MVKVAHAASRLAFCALFYSAIDLSLIVRYTPPARPQRQCAGAEIASRCNGFFCWRTNCKTARSHTCSHDQPRSVTIEPWTKRIGLREYDPDSRRVRQKVLLALMKRRPPVAVGFITRAGAGAARAAVAMAAVAATALVAARAAAGSCRFRASGCLVAAHCPTVACWAGWVRYSEAPVRAEAPRSSVAVDSARWALPVSAAAQARESCQHGPVEAPALHPPEAGARRPAQNQR